MGFGNGSIYDFGCYLVSFVNGLNQKGYSFTPESMNDMLKNANAWVGPSRNYIDVANLHKYFPNVFESFQQIDPWNDVPPTRELLQHNLVVVCRVDARGIGGSGTHFVLLVGEENGVAIIHDPWTGNREPITKRYGNLGNILGLRIFRVKPYNQPEPPTNQPPAEDKDKIISDLKEENKNLRKELENLKNSQAETVKKAIEDTIKQRDKQWEEHLKTKLDEQKTSFKNQQEIRDKEWQSQLDSARTNALANTGGLELIVRGIGKVITGKI